MKEVEDILDQKQKLTKPVLLYVYLSMSSFVNQDIKSFQKQFSVKLFRFQPKHKLLLPISFLRQKLFLIKNFHSASIVVCQFAGYHSLLPVFAGRFLNKPCVIVVGGTDCTSMPSINYGNLRKPLMRWFTLKSLKYANHIVSPSISLIESDYKYTDNDFPKQGYRSFDSSIKTPYTVIYNGINTTHFRTFSDIHRMKNSFLTICTNIDRRNFYLKGLDLFIKMAEYFPSFEFTIIGRISPGFHVQKPANVNLIDYIPNEQLPEIMAGFMFYCQLSQSEGFGVALAEAMACGCVPIVSKVGILDFIARDSGFILDRRDQDLLKSLIDRAVESDVVSLGKKARNRIVENFEMIKRRIELLKLINDLLGGKKFTT
jgi:glycosyltransferase involved in cell wall biosynthesis